MNRHFSRSSQQSRFFRRSQCTALTRRWRSRTKDIAAAMMFGDAVRLGVGRRLFVHARAPIDIPVIRLYGAYGPYGGSGYWAAYTSGGWGNRW